MDYKGAALRAQPEDYTAAAADINVPEAALRAVMVTETDGRGFIADGRPEILFEPHKFYANTSGAERKRAVREGVAYPRWGMKPYPHSTELVWVEYMKAVSINEVAAMKSTSWGLGQIMGSEYEEAGYGSPEEMVAAFCESEANQIKGMCSLIHHRGLDVDMRHFPAAASCRHFALRYNGAGYRKNHYDTKLASAFEKFDARVASAAPLHEDGVLRIGSRGERVRSLQTLLAAHGYHLHVDGDYGKTTRGAVLAWQADNDLATTGEVTAEELAQMETSPDKPLSVERQTVKASDLKSESRIVAGTSLGKRVTQGAVAVIGAAKGAQSTGLLANGNPLDQAQGLLDKANQAKSIAGQVHELLHATGLDTALTFVDNHILIVVGVVGAAAYWIFHRIEKARVEMHQSGETV